MSVRPTDSWNVCLNTTLEQEDKEIYDIVENEKLRQWSGLELIASEVCIWENFQRVETSVFQRNVEHFIDIGILLFYRTSLLKPLSRLTVPL